MAIYTLSTSANYSAIKGSLANGDTIRIDTNAVRLTIDEQPLLTNITVDSPGVSGRVTVSGAYDLSTWSTIAGTVTLIDGTFPAGATLGTVTAGTALAASGVGTNAGTIINVFGGTGQNARGCVDNIGTIENVTGGSGAGAVGIVRNSATVGTATGGTGDLRHGIEENRSCVTKAVGGSSATAYGINQCYGICLEAEDNTARGVNNFLGGPKLINGPEFKTGTTNYTAVPLIYSIGQVSNLAAIPGTIPITILTTGSGGFSGIKRIDRNIGT